MYRVRVVGNNRWLLIMKGVSLDNFGGSCIIEKVHGKRAEDYDDYENEYQPFLIKRFDERY